MNRFEAESITVWAQHGVGDAGFRTEQSYQVFYRLDDRHTWQSPLFYVPVVAGTLPRDAVAAAFVTHAQADRVELHTRAGVQHFDRSDVL